MIIIVVHKFFKDCFVYLWSFVVLSCDNIIGSFDSWAAIGCLDLWASIGCFELLVRFHWLLGLTCDISLVESLLAFCFSSSWILATQYSWFSFRFLVSRQLILRGFFLHFSWHRGPDSPSVSVSSSESLPVLSTCSGSDWPTRQSPHTEENV